MKNTLLFALLVLATSMACGGTGISGPTPTPTPTPNPTPTPSTAPLLRETQAFDISAGTIGFRFPALPPSVGEQTFVATWNTGQVRLFITNDQTTPALQACAAANFVCSAIVATGTGQGNTLTAVSAATGSQLFFWVIVADNTPSVSGKVDIYSVKGP